MAAAGPRGAGVGALQSQPPLGQAPEHTYHSLTSAPRTTTAAEQATGGSRPLSKEGSVRVDGRAES